MKIFIIISLFLTSTLMAEDFSKDKILQNLKSYSKADLTKINDFYINIQYGSNIVGSGDRDEELVFEICRVALLTFIKDPTHYSAEIMYGAYQKNKDLFLKVFKRFPLKSKQKLKSEMDILEKIAKEGQG